MDERRPEREAVAEPLPRGGFLRAVMDNVAEGLLALDRDGELMYLNPAAEALLGWRREEVTGARLEEILSARLADGRAVAPEEHPATVARRAGEVVRAAEHVVTRRDGHELAVQITAAPFESLAGRGAVVLLTELGRCPAAAPGDDGVTQALAEGRFALHAQPIVHVATGRTKNHELLIRMVDRDGGLVPPARFLPAAEASGSIIELDRWVSREAIALAGQGHSVQLNLSAVSLAAPGLIDHFGDELARHDADPALIVIEMTETAVAEASDAARCFIDRARALGCRLALDDFGSGYGGFHYLKRLPVDYLKIDTEFVRDLPRSTGSRHIVEAVTGLARSFGKETVAEGVEDEETMRILGEVGVDYAQGYAVGRPAPVAEVLTA